MPTQKPIRISSQARWRDLRLVYLPPVVFVCLVCTIAWMWSQYVDPFHIVGEVATTRANVISVTPGRLIEVSVNQLQKVTNGQEVAVLRLLSTEQFEAELQSISADLNLMRTRMELDLMRNRSSFQDFRMQFLRDKADLAIDEVNLTLAVAEYERAQRLFESVPPLVSAGELDTAKARRDALRVAVAEKRTYLTERERALPALDADRNEIEQSVHKAIAAQQQRLLMDQQTVLLKSPINGFVSVIHRHPGENVTAGDPILIISGEDSDRIVAWLRPPLTTAPKVGDQVLVRRNTTGRSSTAEAVILAVGGQFEPISPTLLGPSSNPNRVELGLPFIVQTPASLKLLPGEAVQILLKN